MWTSRDVVRLQLKLLSAKVLIWFASAGRDVELKPETNLYLADVHFRLAAAYDALHNQKLSRHHKSLGNEHAAEGPSPSDPPAAALAMPLPQPYLFTDARGRIVEVDDPSQPA